MKPAFDSHRPALFAEQIPDEPGSLITLDESEGAHLKALRLRKGDPVVLLDGNGKKGLGVIEEIQRRDFRVRIERTFLEEVESGLYIGLAFGLLSDKSRLEWIIEKSVELGADFCLPLQTFHSEGHLNRGRVDRVALAALKQSQRFRLPVIPEPIEFDNLSAIASDFTTTLLCHEQGDGRDNLWERLTALRDRHAMVTSAGGSTRLLILVGPEGGFSDEEVERAKSVLGAEVVSLGSGRLRAETAAVAALAAAMLAFAGV